jgi:hypothetical protein
VLCITAGAFHRFHVDLNNGVRVCDDICSSLLILLQSIPYNMEPISGTLRIETPDWDMYTGNYGSSGSEHSDDIGLYSRLKKKNVMYPHNILQARIGTSSPRSRI